MGYALAEEGARRGHEVILVSGPVNLATPPGVQRVEVLSAQEMYEAVVANLENVDLAIHSAAVADYRPKESHAQKVKKQAEEWSLTLERTTDILGSMREPLGFDKTLIGFAAETENLLANARVKLSKKGCDLVVANDVSRRDIGFDRPDNEVTLLFKDGREEAVPKQSKASLAALILDRVPSIHPS